MEPRIVVLIILLAGCNAFGTGTAAAKQAQKAPASEDYKERTDHYLEVVPGLPKQCQDAHDTLLPVYGGSPPCSKAEPQSPRDVSKSFVGLKVPHDDPMGREAVARLVHVNTHFHLGAEHRSEGEYDQPEPASGSGRRLLTTTRYYDGPHGSRRLSETAQEVLPGFFCPNKLTAAQNAPFEFKYCDNVKVGYTYELHWVHSTGGESLGPGLGGAFTWQQNPDVVVQAQSFIVANDATGKFDMDLMYGKTFDTLGKDVVGYVGSTTGQKYNNDDKCSPYNIHWLVDRKCHVVSAKSLDGMCKLMKEKHGMAADAEPHGCRALVSPALSSSELAEFPL